MAQLARQTVGVTRMLGLALFMATAALFVGGAVSVLLGSLVVQVPVATAFAYLTAAVGVLAMLIDSYDLWVRGRRVSEKTVRNLRRTVLVAVLGTVAGALATKNLSPIVFIAPSLVVYFAAIRRPVGAAAGPGGPGRPGGSRSSGAGRPRQRRGGRKRR